MQGKPLPDHALSGGELDRRAKTIQLVDCGQDTVPLVQFGLLEDVLGLHEVVHTFDLVRHLLDLRLLVLRKLGAHDRLVLRMVNGLQNDCAVPVLTVALRNGKNEPQHVVDQVEKRVD